MRKKTQKLYRMRGCSKKNRKYLGGSAATLGADVNLAYPSNNVPNVRNPFLAYTGGANINAAYPNTGPPRFGWGFINPQAQRGGCGCGLLSGGRRTRRNKRETKGGFCPACAAAFMLGGQNGRGQNGRGQNGKVQNLKGGNAGIPYPDGLVGSPTLPGVPSTWPGVGGIPGDNNYYAYNNYRVDPQLEIIATGANPPFSLVGGRKTRKQKQHSKKGKQNKHKHKQKGGDLTGILPQDLVNLGRQFQFGVGSAYNALTGYPAPVNPQPWADQLPKTTNLQTIRAASV